MRKLLILILCVVGGLIGVPVLAEPQGVREPAVAGYFYPANENLLKEKVAKLLADAPTHELSGKPIAIISPHAGYEYSGLVAAHGYKAIRDRGYRRIIVLGPSHYGRRYRGISILEVTHYRTPLGSIELDQEVCQGLLKASPVFEKKYALFGTYSGAHTNEHSIEVQLPFLQMSQGDFKLAPMLIGLLMEDDFDKAAEAIRPYINDDTLIVASSDFTHYGPNYNYIPFQSHIEENIKAMDTGAIEKILAKDFKGLMKYHDETGITICGLTPIALLLKLLPEKAQGQMLAYDTSGRQTGDFTNSVSYTSIVFTLPGTKKAEGKTEMRIDGVVLEPPTVVPVVEVQPSRLTEEEKDILCRLARQTLETFTRTNKMPGVDPSAFSPRLCEKSGVFVTLKERGELRGCIGHVLPQKALWEAVMENAVNSAFRDWRFIPVRKEELDAIEIEISVLTPPVKVNGPEDFVVGKHGIMIKKEGHSALFLPQVAPEQGWERSQTLGFLCEKAGLPFDAWHDKDMEFYVFTAEVFHESRKK